VQNKVLQQMISYNKIVFDNTFTTMMALQEQTERMFNTYLEQTTGLPGEWKKAFGEWSETYKKSCDDYRRSAEEGFQKLEAIFTPKK